MKTNDDLGKIKELVEIIKDKADTMSLLQHGQSASIRLIKEQMSVMNKKLDTLDDPDTGLERINGRLDSNTAAVVNLESTIKAYGDMYKINGVDIRKVEKRVKILEDEAGIESPPELQLAA